MDYKSTNLPESITIEVILPAATGWRDVTDDRGYDSAVPYWDVGDSVITAWTGGVDIDDDYRDNLAELRAEALAFLAAVMAAEQMKRTMSSDE